MKVFVTKYALTQGILEIEANVSPVADTLITEVGTKYPTYYHKPFWYSTREEAVVHANTLVRKKISSLQKQLKKMQATRFFA